MESCDTALKAQARALVPVLITAGEKKPVEWAWQEKRYTPDELQKRYANNPDLNVGLLLGPAGGVIDIECDGPESPTDKAELFRDCEKPETVSWEARRGDHELYAWDDRLAAIGKATIKWRGVEVRLGTGGKAAQSLLPPSTTDGFTRRWIHDLDTPIAKLPDVVIKRLLAASKPKAAEVSPATNSVEDDYCRRADWRKLLEPHGWQYVATSDVGEQFRRPGKSEGTSAGIVTAADGRRLLHVFTDGAPPLEPDTNYSAFAAYSLLNHNGDDKAAREALAKDYGGFSIPLITCAELDGGSYEQEYLIDQTMVARQPMVFAGSKKTLKTTLLIDLAISLASGRPFLGNRTVNRQCSVIMLSGESGMPTLQETARRIAHAKGLKLAAIDRLAWSAFLPKLDKPEHLQALERAIQQTRCEVLVVDPAYLAMPGTDAGNLFIQGAMLRDVSGICERNGVALVLAHHTRKLGKGKTESAPPELDDIAWSGFSEFARQWMLLGRREPYEPGTGEHKLWLNVGGSAGHSDLLALDISEGPSGASPRLWQVAVSTPEHARREQRQQKQAAKDGESTAALIEAARQYPLGETFSILCETAELPRSADNRAIIQQLVSAGRMKPTKVVKGKRQHNGFALAT